ncbi:ATP-binding protein [Phytohabitans sp. ZYX-F-186]|uniref:ATP-binding protein n=1 Tax=Phytohabitans maris TaxID=3071409 RepID=A0ABU0ZJ14_9ACTN|nr:ATP-binding protein [Phytohabitans sp. ZYX-F-186]MDQ7906362.1 ATP-binding protein [Phytohabitans sp. ZYX-F-186]
MPDGAEIAEFGRLFQEFLQLSLDRATARPSELIARLTDHLGVEPMGLPVVAESYQTFDHANVQVAIEAYLAGDGRSAEVVGIAGQGMRDVHSLAEMVELAARHGAFAPGGVDYATAPAGVGVERRVVNFGIFLICDGPVRLAALLRGSSARHGRPIVQLEVLCADPAGAQGMLAELRQLMVIHNVFRGQVVSFEPHDFGMVHGGVGPLRFHARPALDAGDVVLPPGALDAVDRQIVGMARHRDRLRAAGHALKRGVLLFGPPGTGKTHTVRYLMARLPEFTVVLLPGMAQRFVQHACGLARLLQPALVVLEDVDLVAESRDTRPGMDNPLLFQVLNEMDGLAGDADVAFLLTTNRADLLEAALAQRPGRVDLAVELPLPDEAGRAALLRLYARGLPLTEPLVAEVVAATAGMTASFFTELARRATLLAALAGGTPPAPDHLRAALAELRESRRAVAAG